MRAWFSGWLRRRFVHPMSPAPRTAILVPWFRAGNCRVFEPCDEAAIEAWKPAVVAARRSDIERLTVRPTHALVVFTTATDPLGPEMRTLLWERFGVPVFEQMTDENGRLLAWECEGHEGLHLACGRASAPDGEIREGLCDCGKNAIRVFPRRVNRPTAPTGQQLTPSAAATAR